MVERHFHNEIKSLEQSLVKMGLLVEEALEDALSSLFQRSRVLAQKVIDHDQVVNTMEITIDEKAHKLLALGQPMAVDLRMVTMALKMNTVMERIGDHAVNIAEQAIYIMDESDMPTSSILSNMAEAVKRILSDVLDAFLKGDAVLARSILKEDDIIDSYNEELYNQMIPMMESGAKFVKPGVHMITISHNLERIADLVNNIAEDVVYMKQAAEVRHHTQI